MVEQLHRRSAIGRLPSWHPGACWSWAPRPAARSSRTRSARSGRRVVLSTGEHVRMPRTYRGRDVFRWLESAGVLDETYDQMDDLIRARHVPSPQLIGTPERRDIDMNTLRDQGVEVVGKLGTIRDGVALFSGGLGNTYQLADMKLKRLLDRFDAWAAAAGVADSLTAPDRPEPTRPDATDRIELDLRARGHRDGRSGRPATDPTIRGSTSRSSATRGPSATRAGSSPSAPGCTCWGPPCCADAGRRTSGARPRTPRTSRTICWPTWGVGCHHRSNRFPPDHSQPAARPLGARHHPIGVIAGVSWQPLTS